MPPISPRVSAPSRIRIERHRSDNDGALDQRLEIGIERKCVKYIGENGEKEEADGGTPDGAFAAEEGGAPDNHDRYRVERHGSSDVGLADTKTRSDDHSAESRESADQRVSAYLEKVDAQPRKSRGLGIATNGVK